MSDTGTGNVDAAISAATALYRNEPAGIRAFVQARRWLAPVGAIVRRVPATGSVLDVGCGHGLFSLILASADPARRIVGVDPSPAKMAVAMRVGRPFPNLTFRQEPIDAIGDERFAAILILDVLYLLPPALKLDLLTACRRRLAAGGVLLVKTNDTTPAWKYRIARAQESAMTALGLTMGGGELYFLSARENAAMIERAGFTVEIERLSHWTPYPHMLMRAR